MYGLISTLYLLYPQQHRRNKKKQATQQSRQPRRDSNTNELLNYHLKQNNNWTKTISESDRQNAEI